MENKHNKNPIHSLDGLNPTELNDLKLEIERRMAEYRQTGETSETTNVADLNTLHQLIGEIDRLTSELQQRDEELEQEHKKNNFLSLNSILPNVHVKPNNKLANKITNGLLDIGEFQLIVSGKKAEKEIRTTVKLAYENNNINLSSNIKFTPYDRVVQDAVATLYHAGNEVFTPAMIYRAMNGLTEKETPTAQAIGAVTKSIEKSRRIMVEIDFTDEAIAYDKKVSRFVYNGHLLDSKQIIIETGGKEIAAYKLLDVPILYEYAQISGQILSVPIEILNTKAELNSTDEVIVIRDYLLRNIEGMKSKTFRRSRNILFESIYKELEVTPESHSNYKKKTQKIRSQAESVLRQWIKYAYIKGFSRYNKGKTIVGITIELEQAEQTIIANSKE